MIRPIHTTQAQPPGRVPPHSTEAEEQLLSAILLDGKEVMGKCAIAGVKPESFYIPANRVAYERLCEMADANKALDIAVLAEELKATRQLDEIGGYGYLTRISGRIPTTAGTGYFIEKVLELAMLRDVARAATAVVEETYSYSGGIREFADKVERDIMAVTQRRISGEQSKIKDVADLVWKKIERLQATKGQSDGLPTGFHDIDRLLYGLHAPDLVVIAGRPSCGKTSLAMNFGENVTMRKGKSDKALVFSMEMSKEQLVQRMICSRARVEANRVQGGFCRPDEMARLKEAEQDIAKSGLLIDDTSALTVLELRARARRIHQRTPLSLIIVDYLQLMSGSDSSALREQQVAECSRGLKSLAKELSVPVIVLSQLNRSAEKENRRPRLSDLRESGAVEQDADVVMMLSRPKDEGNDSQVAAERMELIIAKNRNGAVDDLLLTFQGSITRFSNYIA